MENPKEEDIFGKEHHEVRANRFIDDAREAAKKYTDLETVVTNLTEEELEMGSETTLAAELEDKELAEFIKDEDRKLESESAETTVVSIHIAGDDRFRIAEALGIFDSLAAKEKGSRWSNTGQIKEHGLKKVPIPIPAREDIPAKECLALYEFR